MDHATLLTLGIAGIATFGVIVRPWALPEYLWATLGAAVLVVSGLLPWHDALAAAQKGTDVYLFLIGMMLLAEVARLEGLFDWLAAHAVRAARGSAKRLFAIVYAVGTLTTIFLSNDATAVVLTPAVLAVTRQAGVKPLPYLLACALVANAASFVLPVSNPANLVVFGAQLPALGDWLARFALPSLLSIAATYAVLRWLSRADLSGRIEPLPPAPVLSSAGRCAAIGLALTTVVLLWASAVGLPLGAPTLVCAAAVWLAVARCDRARPWAVLRNVSWSVVPLVAGLFVIVAGLQQAGLLDALRALLDSQVRASPGAAAFYAGAGSAVMANLMNNLPAGLIAGSVVSGADHDLLMRSAVLLGIDLGPTLSVTGSLATILWLAAIRRAGIDISAWTFLKTGLRVMPLVLLAAGAGLWLQAGWLSH